MTERRASKGRRAEDHFSWRSFFRENWYRDIWLTLISAFVVWSVIATTNIVDDVQEGRKAGLPVTCAATSAVIDAGRATITGGASGVSGRFERELERLGYPPKKVRQKQAEKAAEAYAAAISKRVEDATGVTGIVRRNGTLDCDRLAELSHIN